MPPKKSHNCTHTMYPDIPPAILGVFRGFFNYFQHFWEIGYLFLKHAYYSMDEPCKQRAAAIVGQ